MGNDQEEAPESPEVDFEPIMKLPLVEIKTLEEDEEELVKLRAKLFRYDTKDVPAEWKERGTGEVKILRHKEHETVRIVMRRDKTLKICANHCVQPFMEVHFKSGSDKALVWSTPADYADEEPKPELLAIKFATAENCLKFKEAFEKGLLLATKKESDSTDTSVDEKDNPDCLKFEEAFEKGLLLATKKESDSTDTSVDEKDNPEDGHAEDQKITEGINKLSLIQQESIESEDVSSGSKFKETLKEETLTNSTCPCDVKVSTKDEK